MTAARARRPESGRTGRGTGPAPVPSRPSAARPAISRDAVIDTASRLVEEHGADALTMRRLSEELGVAVTAIYWHVGNRDALLDALVDRLVADMGTLPASGDTARDRIASLAEALRRRLLDLPHLTGLAYERDRTPEMFQPVEQAMAAELARVGVRGKDAALALRALSTHVVGSIMLERAALRADRQIDTAAAWPADADDLELVEALAVPPDRDVLFAVGLDALLEALVPAGPAA